MSTLLARRVHSARWGGRAGTSTTRSSGSSPNPEVRESFIKEIRLLYTTRPAAWNKSRPPSRHSRPANLHEHDDQGMYIEISGFRRGEWCSCNATRVEQFIALRISPADISIIDSNSGFGMTFKAGMAWIALSIIVLAMGLNLRQRRNARNVRDMGSCRMVENIIS